MRNHLVDELGNLAEEFENLYVLTGDLGFGVLDDFAQRFPDRFINAGISEQNMTAVAVGMALEGNIVYTYSIGNFPGMRCLEWIRNDACYHNANLKIVVVGGGFAYGQLGMSHHATEDIAIMRALPNMHVFSPADPAEAIETVRYANSINGPCYIRLGKGREPDLHPDITEYDVTKALELAKGEKIAIVATGSIIGEAKKAIEALAKKGYKVGLYNFITLKPIDSASVKAIAKEYDVIISLEEHNVVGGLGSAIADELVLMEGPHAILYKLGLQDEYTSIVGSQEFLRDYYKMSSKHIIQMIETIYEKNCALK